MPLIQPDTSQAVVQSAIAPGTYHGKIVSCDFQTSKAGNPMIVPKFVLNVDGKERPRQAYLNINGEGSGSFDTFLRAAGFSELADKYRDPSGEKPLLDTDSLIGIEMDVVIEENIYKNEKRDQIKTFLKA